MTTSPAFSSWVSAGRFTPGPEISKNTCSPALPRNQRVSPIRREIISSLSSSSEPEELWNNEHPSAERMRQRLQGLFGEEDDSIAEAADAEFDGEALRATIRNRWGVEYDVQPQKRHGRVYVQIMWRYFEQQSFYMEEEEFASHCEAVAQLLQQWNAVDYFCDYVSSIKKKPVVGITINIPIPGVNASTVELE